LASKGLKQIESERMGMFKGLWSGAEWITGNAITGVNKGLVSIIHYFDLEWTNVKG
jgi:hypothetical protein